MRHATIKLGRRRAAMLPWGALSAIAAISAAGQAQAPTAPPGVAQTAPGQSVNAQPIPEAEEATVATLPPPSSRWAFVNGGFGSGRGTRIWDGDTGKMRGMVDTSQWSDLAIDPAGRFYYVAESIWTRGDRGQRQDFVAVYDSQTMKLLTEFDIPGRLIIGARKQNFVISQDGATGFIYKLEPSSAVNMVDLARRRFVRTIELPGCASLFPTPDNGFAALCGDGTIARVKIAGRGQTIERTRPFFAASDDPVFENGAHNRATGEVSFVSYSGQVYPVRLGPTTEIGQPWSLQAAAGMPAGTTAPVVVNWLPGGQQPVALHAATNRMFVLMHIGEFWSSKEPGTEIWVVDLAGRRILKRVKIDPGATNIAVTQDASPLLIVGGGRDSQGKVRILDGLTFEEKKAIDRAGSGVLSVYER